MGFSSIPNTSLPSKSILLPQSLPLLPRIHNGERTRRPRNPHAASSTSEETGTRTRASASSAGTGTTDSPRRTPHQHHVPFASPTRSRIHVSRLPTHELRRRSRALQIHLVRPTQAPPTLLRITSHASTTRLTHPECTSRLPQC